MTLKMLFLVVLSVCLTMVSGHGVVEALVDGLEDMWQQFITENAKCYDCDEKKAAARLNFVETIKEINQHNEAFEAGNVSYAKQLYHFSDMNEEDALNILCGTELPPTTRSYKKSTLDENEAAELFPEGPDSKNWTEFLLPVQNQRDCGSCWSFSSIAQVESLYKRSLPAWEMPFSQQHLIDCSKVNTVNGCKGGWPTKALDYLKENGLVPDMYYPYRANASECGPMSKLVVFPLIKDTYEYVLNGNENIMKNIVAQEGPVVIIFYVNKNFTHYKGGVFEDFSCPTDCQKLNHAMLLVGYGTDDSYNPPKDYWIIRNSWGDKWGEGGYARVIRNKGTSCQAACYAMYTTKY